MSTSFDSSQPRDLALLDRLLKAGASVPSKEQPRPPGRDIRSCDAMPGQVWRTRPPEQVPEEEAITHWVLVLGRQLFHETPVYRVAPMFTDTVMADPQDAVLPPEILGFEAAFAFGLALSTTPAALDSCVATLPVEWSVRLLHFGRCVDGSSRDRAEGIDSGIPYLDELDGRIEFHAELLAELAYLQSATARLLDDQESTRRNVVVLDPRPVPEPSDLAHRAAAATPLDSTESKPVKRFIECYEVVGLGVLLQLESNDLDPDLRVVAATQEGHPTLALDGFALLTEAGGRFSFESGAASIPLEGFSGSLQLVSASGTLVALRKIED
jgi:hypothetical protein